MTPRSRLLAAIAVSAIAITLGVLAAWPIYQTGWLFVVAVAALLIGVGLGVGVTALAGRWPMPVLVATVIAVFAISAVPIAMPDSIARMAGGSFGSIASATLSAMGNALAAVVLGWKQLLTLTLPVGSYQTVLVPVYLVFLLTALLVTCLRGSRFAPFAAAPLVAPVLFGTVFGSSDLSATLVISGGETITAPRELGFWFAAALLGAAWVAWASGRERRAALRRLTQNRLRRASTRAGRFMAGVTVLVAASLVGLIAAPAIDSGGREVPRDTITPEVVLREQPSPLAGYRLFKSDDLIDEPLFSVEAQGDTPPRLRLAVLDAYDGVDFHVGVISSEAESTFGVTESGRFTRFPSAGTVAAPVEVTVQIDEGYSDIWAPTAGLGSVPVFSGPRADALADALYVNRATGAAIVVPDSDSDSDSDEAAGQGLAQGDGYRATMSAAPEAEISGRPVIDSSQLDLAAMPELAEWVEAQGQPATGQGLIELIERLRARGYLSHSLTEGNGSSAWLTRLAQDYGTVFWPSAGGHSVARVEQLFGQLNAQQRRVEAAGAVSPGSELGGTDEQLVAGVGDDEQFATAAALIARALGFDSRVVLGVRLDGATEVPGVPDCTSVCTGENIAAWVEVRGAEGVWAPIDTTPQVEIRPSSFEEGEQLPEYPTTPEERDAHEVEPPIGVGNPDDGVDESQRTATSDWVWPLIRVVSLSLLALLLLAIPLLFLPLAKRFRAARRRDESNPELRALGAWQELLDGLLDLGGLPRGSETARLLSAGSRLEIAERLDEVAETAETSTALRGESVWRAAILIDRAVFSAEGITDAEADEAWDLVEKDLAARRATLSFWRRLRARYSLRSYRARLAEWQRSAGESRQREVDTRAVGRRSNPRRHWGRK